jgi:hypothetical protein
MKITIEGREIELTEEKAKEVRELLGIKPKTLAEVAIGDTFHIGEYEFIKFADNNGQTTAVMKYSIFDSKFDENTNNFAKSSLYKRLVKEVLPKIEKIVGAENIVEFETDLFTADGLDIYGTMKSKISLPTFDFYRSNRAIFDKYPMEDWWWVSTANGNERYAFCVSPHGYFNNRLSNYDYFGVRPFLIFDSNIFVS